MIKICFVMFSISGLMLHHVCNAVLFDLCSDG